MTPAWHGAAAVRSLPSPQPATAAPPSTWGASPRATHRCRDRLPSTRTLANIQGVAHTAIRHAQCILRDDGRVDTWQGRGPFIAKPGKDVAINADLGAQARVRTWFVQYLDERIARLERSDKPARTE